MADRFADAVAPDFSNRIRDGRWVTILAWCLVQSQQVFHASGEKAVQRVRNRARDMRGLGRWNSCVYLMNAKLVINYLTEMVLAFVTIICWMMSINSITAINATFRK
jgi:hypothetical protein